jgi:hypothetical protein
MQNGKTGKGATKIFLSFFVFSVLGGIKGVYNRNVPEKRKLIWRTLLHENQTII